ncbi:hypothetical protein ACU686_30505 [Yinghuangia aomiensis]
MSIAVVDRRRIAAFAQALDELESGLAPSRGKPPETAWTAQETRRPRHIWPRSPC